MEKKRLYYFVPDKKRKKTTLQIPESHDLHVCPGACGRRHALRAVRSGEKQRVSFLQMTQADLVFGDYIKKTVEAVGELLKVLEPAPKAITLYFNCVDDLLGTDERALERMLCRTYPDTAFCILRNDPISGMERRKTGEHAMARLYSLLQKTEEKDRGINLLGNYVPLPPESEFFTLLEEWGIGPVRQIITAEHFSEYTDMAKSCLNLAVMSMGRFAGEYMKERLDIPFLLQPVEFSMARVRENYRLLAAFFGCTEPDFSRWELPAKAAVSGALAAVGDRGIVLDDSATMRPLALAEALLEYGFPVRGVLMGNSKSEEKPEQFMEKYPSVRIILRDGRTDLSGDGFFGEMLCIGRDCAWLLKARHFVDIWHDEGYYGYQGIGRLMGEIAGAMEKTAIWEGET